MSRARRTIRWGAAIAALALSATVANTVASAASADASATPLALTSQQLAGQRVIYSYPGLTPPQSLFNDIRAGRVAGVIFFGENISSTTQIAGVVQQLRDASAQSPVQQPLLLMTDQEGGQVRRLPGAPVLSEKQVGLSSNPPLEATNAGTGAGQNLRSAKMNVNLAPVLDVYRTAGDLMDQYGRSYSQDSATVGVLGRNFIRAQQATGVAATAKHYPGLGAASSTQNTDTRAVTLNVSLSDLRTKDEPPYYAAIDAGVKLVMVSWAVYPALDSSRPAGLSRTIVQTELRHNTGFQGVTITDALEAGALQAYGSTGNRSVLAAGAGMDLILASARDVSQGEAAVNALAAAYDNGTLNQAEFTASVNRITALRSTLP
ncbi:glycoside hydrolase family 3 N-terminal domain-containing protein [Labedaea rhizosphaerae]|uniref:Beta-N-acetylhexosaminidase n=1 Tax=Labedaea rhizosphaerae TaxID=598644 RepID=A0A4R6SI83_LABRH|nr:glycoside hydrolase family 3 N-terminal domain-containing protein [Labedaea rhizosphaerae]TDQ01373.1 beta-N-acetylhexosaminidase [Labedaea rhizosphaerae]